jgi:polar amino acid transport system substrate-binding protein
MKNIFFIVILLLLNFSPHGFAASYIFASSEFSGISEQSKNGKLSGLGVDIIKKVAEDLDINIEIKIYPFNRMMYLVKNKSVDAAFGIYKNPEREKFMDYIDVSFFNDSYQFYTNSSTQISWNGEMESFPKDSVFCWVRGWSYFEELHHLKDKLLFRENSSLEGCLNMLIGNRFDLLAGPIRDIVPLIKKLGYVNQVNLVSKDKGREGNYVAFPKGHLPLLQLQVKQSLIKILNSKWYKKKLQQYSLVGAMNN